MTNFTNIEAALAAINDEVAQDAWTWLENNKPQTAKAIRYLIEVEVAKVKTGNVSEPKGDRTLGAIRQRSEYAPSFYRDRVLGKPGGEG